MMDATLKLQPVNAENKTSLGFIEPVYTASFPADERREFKAVINLLQNRPAFKISLITADNAPVGFFSFWVWDNIAYIEHFAVEEKWRGSGFGAKAMELLLKEINMPVVLEVEKPEDDISRRRIAFYERLGFTLWKDHFYLQPAYSPDKNPLELLLMTYGDITLTNERFTTVRNLLHLEVYGANISGF